jgi:hypothetical protein
MAAKPEKLTAVAPQQPQCLHANLAGFLSGADYVA